MDKKFKEFTQSSKFRTLLICLGIAVVALVIFQAGIFIGYRKASFSYHFGDNYYRAFGQRGPRPFEVPIRGGFIEAHGATGKIISVNLPTFVVTGSDNIEKVILIQDDTKIRYLDATITPQTLKVSDMVVVIGSPNENSQIEAKLIRVIPAVTSK